MAIDIIARGLATSLIDENGKVAADKMPVLSGTSNLTGFTSVGKLTDPAQIEGKTAEEILMMMLYGVVNPTFTAPSFSVVMAANTPTILTIGQTYRLSGTMVFNRGTIEPAYGTSGYRSGAAISYELNGQPAETADFELTITPSQLDNSIECRVSFAAGEQPKNSIGANYDQPYPAGQLFAEVNLPATYAFYDNAGNPIEFTWYEADGGQGYQAMFPSEGNGFKQSFAVSSALEVEGVKGYDQLNQQWAWFGGSAERSLSIYFDTTTIPGETLGESTDYIAYTYKGPMIGARQMRIQIK